MTTNKIFNRTISVFAAFLVLLCSMTLYSDRSKAANTARTYNVYDAQTGEFLRDYTLNKLADRDNSRKVIQQDDRELDWSKSGVVKIISSFTNQSNVINTVTGTGFVIDDHTILTAAHCLYHAGNGETANFNTEILLFDTEGNITLSATPVESHIPVDFISRNESDYNSLFDFAIITVEEDLSSYACFTLGLPLNSSRGIQVYTTGFPSYVSTSSSAANTQSRHNMYTSTGTITYTSSDLKLHFDADISNGNSGGPLYIHESRCGYNYNTVIGITVAEPKSETAEYNIATRITPISSTSV